MRIKDDVRNLIKFLSISIPRGTISWFTCFFSCHVCRRLSYLRQHGENLIDSTTSKETLANIYVLRSKYNPIGCLVVLHLKFWIYVQGFYRVPDLVQLLICSYYLHL